MRDKPILMGEFHCAPECPFLNRRLADHNSLDARCKKHGTDLEWYDYWLAVCLNDEDGKND